MYSGFVAVCDRYRNKPKPKRRYRASMSFGRPPYMRRPAGNDCPILKLNQDCLLKIFSYLSQRDLINVDKVCPYWKSLADLIWRRFTTFDCRDYYCRYKEDKILKVLTRCGPYVKKIYFPEIDDTEIKLFAALLNVIACNCPNVETVIFETLFFRILFMRNFTRILNRLKHIEFTNAINPMDKKMFRTVLEKSPNLISLSLGNISTIPSFFISQCFPFQFLGLKELNFGWFSPPDENFFNELLIYCPNLEVLSMRIPLQHVKITNQIENLTKLRVLNLEECELSLTQMENFLCFTNLEQLVLTVAKEMNDDFLRKIVSAMPLLNLLDISGSLRRSVTDEGLKELAQLQNLEHLSLSYQKITDKGIEIIALNGKLRELHLVSTLVTDNVVPKVVRHCPNLTLLDLSSCQKLTSKFLVDLNKIFHPGNNRPTLKICIGGINNFSDHAMDIIDNYCDNNLLIDLIVNTRYRLMKRHDRIDKGGNDSDFNDSDFDSELELILDGVLGVDDYDSVDFPYIPYCINLSYENMVYYDAMLRIQLH